MAGLSLRLIQKKTDSGWTTVRMSQLRDGDTFRMFEREAPGDPVVSNGVSEWIVQGVPTKREDGIWQVSVRGDG